jgi:hypothetical protein
MDQPRFTHQPIIRSFCPSRLTILDIFVNLPGGVSGLTPCARLAASLLFWRDILALGAHSRLLSAAGDVWLGLHLLSFFRY